MFRRILVPLDGSPEAEDAIPFAGMLTRASGGTVLLLCLARAAQPEVAIRGQADGEPYFKALEQRRTLPAPVEYGVGKGGEALAVTAAAREWRADLIVLRCGRRTNQHWRFTEDVATDIMRQSPVPVLLLRAGDWASVPAEGGMRTFCPGALRFLVPLDGSELAESAIRPALHLMAALAGASTCVLHLVRVVAVDSRWRMAAQYLDEVATHVRRESAAICHNLEVTWSVIAHVDAAEALERLAEVGEDVAARESWSVARDVVPVSPSTEATGQSSSEFGACDFLVMTTHGRSGLSRWALGSTAEGVLARTGLPILLVRARSGEARREDDDLAVERWRTRPLPC